MIDNTIAWNIEENLKQAKILIKDRRLDDAISIFKKLLLETINDIASENPERKKLSQRISSKLHDAQSLKIRTLMKQAESFVNRESFDNAKVIFEQLFKESYNEKLYTFPWGGQFIRRDIRKPLQHLPLLKIPSPFSST